MQGDNFKVAMAQSSLWTCPRAGGRPLKETRSIIFEMQPGDIVFHHAKGYLRAVSKVRESYKKFERPTGYKRRPGEKNSGWLVTVDPIRTGLTLRYTDLHKFIIPGRPGPMNNKTNMYLGFLSRLSETDGRSLLAGLKLTLPPSDDGLLGRSPDYWTDDETDGTALGKIRKEQADLRVHLLRGRLIAPCSLCGNELPSRLLVAAHIKPRRYCSEEERRDFRSVAMLACGLGCDALFEWGYVTVGGDGKILPGNTTETQALDDAVARLVDRICSAHNENTARNFAEHRLIKMAGLN